MKPAADEREFRVSQMVYGCLLRAYPLLHRAEYGKAMAQLFRDQCRAAYNESPKWGLLKLWLRTLPDVASTSIMERLAALKERKSMTEKLANLSAFSANTTSVFFKVFALVFVAVFTATVVVTYLLPESYASTARIKVENEVINAPAINIQPSVGFKNYDPYFLQTTFEIIQSPTVLNPVIEELNLNDKWGGKYFNGQMPDSQETLKILKARTQLAPIKNTQLISITVFSEDKNEAADIANAIAESYQAYRIRAQNAGEVKLNPALPRAVLVQITDPAEPGHAPVRPNKPVNILLGAGCGIFLAAVVGAVFALVSSLIGQRTSKTVAKV